MHLFHAALVSFAERREIIMNENRNKRNNMLINKVIRGLESRNMEGYYAESKEEALRIALNIISLKSSVSWGGSVSIEEIGLKEALCKGDYEVYNRDICKTSEEKRQVEIKTFASDYFICSTNAITEDGVLMNIDGNSNRVAAIAYGPKHVLLIVGVNKIVKDENAALYRARNEAATINAQRFELDTPCKKNGSCANCKSMDTICCQFLTTRFSRHKGRIKVILINESLGF